MLFFVFDILRLFKGGKRMKTNNYVISLLTAMMIVSQSPVVINANNVKIINMIQLVILLNKTNHYKQIFLMLILVMVQMTYHLYKIN